MSITVARTGAALLNDPSLGPRTRKLYEGILLPFLDQLGPKDVRDVRRDEIEQYLRGLGHLSARTHRLHQTVIHRLFGHGVEQGHMEMNPASHIRRRKPDATRGEHATDEPVRYLTKKQVAALFQAATRNPRLLALVSLLYESGARIAEVLSLELADLDPGTRQFPVIGKGNRRRWCFFGDRTAAALEAYLHCGRHHPHRSLFTERGAYRNDLRGLVYATAYRDLKEAVAGAPTLPGVRFHDLRHTFATERASLIPLEVLRALMGHQSIQTTLIYQKVTSSVARQAAHEAIMKLAKS